MRTRILCVLFIALPYCIHTSTPPVTTTSSSTGFLSQQLKEVAASTAGTSSTSTPAATTSAPSSTSTSTTASSSGTTAIATGQAPASAATQTAADTQVAGTNPTSTQPAVNTNAGYDAQGYPDGSSLSSSQQGTSGQTDATQPTTFSSSQVMTLLTQAAGGDATAASQLGIPPGQLGSSGLLPFVSIQFTETATQLIYNAMMELSNLINQAKADVAAVQSSVTSTLGSTESTLEGKISSIQSQINTLVAQDQHQIDVAQAKLNVVNQSMTALNNQINKCTGAHPEVASQVTQYAQLMDAQGYAASSAALAQYIKDNNVPPTLAQAMQNSLQQTINALPASMQTLIQQVEAGTIATTGTSTANANAPATDARYLAVQALLKQLGSNEITSAALQGATTAKAVAVTTAFSGMVSSAATDISTTVLTESEAEQRYQTMLAQGCPALSVQQLQSMAGSLLQIYNSLDSGQQQLFNNNRKYLWSQQLQWIHSYITSNLLNETKAHTLEQFCMQAFIFDLNMYVTKTKYEKQTAGKVLSEVGGAITSSFVSVGQSIAQTAEGLVKDLEQFAECVAVVGVGTEWVSRKATYEIANAALTSAKQFAQIDPRISALRVEQAGLGVGVGGTYVGEGAAIAGLEVTQGLLEAASEINKALALILLKGFRITSMNLFIGITNITNFSQIQFPFLSMVIVILGKNYTIKLDTGVLIKGTWEVAKEAWGFLRRIFT